MLEAQPVGLYSAPSDALPRRLGVLPLVQRDLVTGVLLVVTLLVGGYFRFVGQNWDDYTHLHPDERFLTGVAAGMGGRLASFMMTNPTLQLNEEQYQRCATRYPDLETRGAGGYFDAECSTWNPHNIGHGLYVYGTLPLFMARVAGDLTVQVTGDTGWGSYEGIHLVWRCLSALADMGVIVVVFVLGTQLHNRWVGLVAAMLYAAAPFPIQQAHFATADGITNFFCALTLLFAARSAQRGGLAHFALAGVCCGLAVASRINVAPLVGLIVLAALVRSVPAFDRRLAWGERERAFSQAVVGLVAAGVLTIVCFRVFNPYALLGPGIFSFEINPRWTADIGQAQYLVSGRAEMPPNWQWVGRASYVFPFTNIVLWGMGLPLGAAAWLAWVWAGWRLVRGRTGALAHLIPVVWIGVYFLLFGRQWVTTMRYYLPMYPALALLAGWALVELVERGASAWSARREGVRGRLAGLGYPVSAALLVGVVGLTWLWGLMFTNIYRHQLTAVQAANWVWENVPGDFSMRIEDAPAGTPLINIALGNNPLGADDDLASQATRIDNGQTVVSEFIAPASGMITHIHAPHIGDSANDSTPETLYILITDKQTGAALSDVTLTQDFPRSGHPVGAAYDIVLDTPLVVTEGSGYQFTVTVASGGPLITAGGIMSWEGDWDEPAPAKVCTLPPGVTLADNPPPGLLAPQACNGRDAWNSLINGYKLQLIYEDVEPKRDRMQMALDNSEWLIIGSNRRYDSQGRNPTRWPMTMRYYDALFSGELGFELAATLEETFELGSLKISDQYLPTYRDAPAWLNEYEAEEAFHVYDHPTVFIFRKTDAYSSENTARILGEVPTTSTAAGVVNFNCPEAADLPVVNFYCDPTLVAVMPLKAEGVDWSLSADQSASSLNLTPAMRALQYTGGTWRERFDPAAVINSQPVITVVAWWLTVLVFGWAVFPLLFTIFPKLADRGYGVAKIAGLLLVAWAAWCAATLRVPGAWSQSGVFNVLIVVAVIGGVAVWRTRAPLGAYVREHWGRLAVIEAITVVAFLVFLGVRLSNPDLWHTGYGGEKPMDFAYFNGVLRSTVFPPIDPWFAGGYINYYYFGFVIVGAPVLLLGVVPSIAYNLIVPTLFAVTGIAAFSVAFNVVSAAADAARKPPGRATAWVAGVMALVLSVVVGNLDTPRVIVGELAKHGGFAMATSLEDFLVREYQEANGAPPAGDERIDITQRAQRNNLPDRLRFEWANFTGGINGVVAGLVRTASGETGFSISPDRFFWGPTRILAEPPVDSGGAITEMPYFTFLYGDLHAHMIAMPVQFLVMAFVLHEVLSAGRDERRLWMIGLALLVGAVAVGMLRATNTWDWITYLVLSSVGLAFAWYLAWRGLSRRSLVAFVTYVGGFVALTFVTVLPFTQWFAAAYSRAIPWEGNRTPIWAYLDIHGLFLFLLVSLLVWDTARWFRSVRVSALRGTFGFLAAGLIAAGMLLLGVILLAMASYQVVLIVVPLVVWIAALFFREGQSREMQYLLALAGLALSLTLAVEFVTLEGDLGRQNTVFKFYLQVWLLFSVVGAAGFAWLFTHSIYWADGLRNVWTGLASVLVFVAALYPMLATPAKAVFRMAPETPLTLDGMEYMRHATQFEGSTSVLTQNPTLAPFPLAEDYAMIRWLQDNVQGTPVIMEGRSEREYLWGSRIAIYTGLPSVVGWNFHQRQQRTFNPLPRMVELRVANVNAFYVTRSVDVAWEMLKFYDVSYVIVGGLERAYYPADSLAKFERMVAQGRLSVAFQIDDSIIYQVNHQSAELEQDNPVAGLDRS